MPNDSRVEQNNFPQPDRSHWIAIIQAIKTPLGFFVFSMLAVEAFLASVVYIAKDDDRTLAIIGMLVIAGSLIVIVAYFAYFKNEVLFPVSSTTSRDALSSKQAQILGIIIDENRLNEEVLQRTIEEKTGFSHASGELFYRLETLILQGFIEKRRIDDGQFAYRLNDKLKREIES